MRAFICLFGRELQSFFVSPLAYVVLFFFWTLTGGNFYWLLAQLADGEPLTMAGQLMFSGPLIAFSLPVVVPLITMRLFAEESKLGTLEVLLTSPVRESTLVLAKFAGVLFFYAVLWLPVLLYVVVQDALSPGSDGFPDRGATFSGFVGVMLVGVFYVAVGLFMSSVTANQVIAAIGSFALLFGGFLAFMFMGYTTRSMEMRTVGQCFSTFSHLLDFSRGMIDSRTVVIYLSHAAWFLFATVRMVELKRR